MNRTRKLIIQIPCYNEEETLETALSHLPRQLDGVDSVEWLIVNDGSTDRTREVARRCGVDHIVDLGSHRGLAEGFLAGIDASLKADADIIVNTDADNQYCADDIPKIIEPILSGRADIVIGARPISEIEHFSLVKKILQGVGSWVVRVASNTSIPDAPSGFRAMTREAAMRLNVFNPYTYTLETIIQAGQKRMAVESVPVRTNPELRPSRLVKSVASYVRRSILTILRIFITYKPLRFFLFIGALPFAAGFALGVRWIFLFYEDPTRARVPSLILAAILILTGVQLWIFGILADIIAVNRALLEDIQLRLRKMEYQ
jgi:glycosyltransferase involved in cell wall biosynthesis